MLKKIKQALGMSSYGNEYVGSVCTFAGPFAPRGYVDCDGRKLSIKDHQELFSIIGTMYGGDGINDFAVPDLRPLSEDGQPDTGLHRKVDWTKVGKPRQVICCFGDYPFRP